MTQMRKVQTVRKLTMNTWTQNNLLLERKDLDLEIFKNQLKKSQRSLNQLASLIKQPALDEVSNYPLKSQDSPLLPQEVKTQRQKKIKLNINLGSLNKIGDEKQKQSLTARQQITKDQLIKTADKLPSIYQNNTSRRQRDQIEAASSIAKLNKLYFETPQKGIYKSQNLWEKNLKNNLFKEMALKPRRLAAIQNQNPLSWATLKAHVKFAMLNRRRNDQGYVVKFSQEQFEFVENQEILDKFLSSPIYLRGAKWLQL